MFSKKMTIGFVALSLSLLSSSMEMSARVENKAGRALVPGCSVDQMLIDQSQFIDGKLTLTCSGEYRAKENLVGTIVINGSSICVDLGCHTLDANGAANAIVIENMQGVKVGNGTILSSTEAGIFVKNVASVSLYSLFMHDHAIDAIRFQDSTGLHVSDIDFLGTTQTAVAEASLKPHAHLLPAASFGERALHFDTCTNFTVNQCNISGFLNTIGSIIELDTCSDASIENTDLSTCVNGATESNGSFAQPCFVSVIGCSGVDFVHVKVNNNFNINEVTFGYEAIGFFFSPDCTLYRCETSNNTNVAPGPESGDNQVLIFASDNVVVTEHYANNNSCAQPYAQNLIYYSLFSNNTIFDGCQANNNSMAELAVLDSSFSMLSGFTIQSDSCIIRNSQANFNTVIDGGTRPATRGQLGALYPIWVLGNNTLIDHSQANNNVMETTGLSQSVVGILVDVVSNTTILHSTMNNNSGGEVAAGIDLFQADGAQVRNCTANNNGGWGIGSDYYFFPSGPVTNAEIIDCECHGNGGDAFSAGIFINGNNVLVKGCHVNDTASDVTPASISGDLAGIIVQSASNVVIEDSSVFNSRSINTEASIETSFKAHGILFDSVTDSNIVRTQEHGNENAGVELVTSSYIPFVFTNPAALAPIRAFYTRFGPSITSSINASGELADPTNACTSLSNDLAGKIGIVIRDGSCGSAKFVLDTEAAHALATLIIDNTGNPGNFAGSPNQTKVALVISQEDGEALLRALQNNPGLTLTLETVPFSDNDTISIIESTAKGNDIGFEFAAGSTATCCLVQDSRALNNKTAGFVHGITPLTTTFIGNEAQCNGTKAEDNYVIADPANNAINLQEYAWNDGTFKNISPRNRGDKHSKKGSCDGGKAACGARFTNIRAVREHAKNHCK